MRTTSRAQPRGVEGGPALATSTAPVRRSRHRARGVLGDGLAARPADRVAAQAQPVATRRPGARAPRAHTMHNRCSPRRDSANTRRISTRTRQTHRQSAGTAADSRNTACPPPRPPCTPRPGTAHSRAPDDSPAGESPHQPGHTPPRSVAADREPAATATTHPRRPPRPAVERPKPAQLSHTRGPFPSRTPDRPRARIARSIAARSAAAPGCTYT